MKTIYVLPNISTFSQRWSLVDRTVKAQLINSQLETTDFQLVEVPGDFIKNPSEIRATNLPLGAMLTPSAVSILYESKDGQNMPYVLHTEPSLRRTGIESALTPHLRWFDQKWIAEFIQHIISIIDFLSELPAVLEIHPGSSQQRKNSISAFVNGLNDVIAGLLDHYGSCPLIFIENRTSHVVSTGKSIQEFWEQSTHQILDFKEKSNGIILDVQQFHTRTKDKFDQELDLIPPEALAGFHIHQKHGIPKMDGPINWNRVRKFIQNDQIRSPLHILPEVHHFNQVHNTYRFCKDILGL